MLLRTTTTRRAGLTLLEVLVALAVFLLSVVGLGTLTSMSMDRAAEVRQQSWAIQRCQSKLAEVIAGVVPLSGQTDQAFEEDPDWIWSLDIQDSGITGLSLVTVRVKRQASDRSSVETSLTQMVLDPALKGGSAPPATTDSGAASSGSGSTPSGGSSGGRP